MTVSLYPNYIDSFTEKQDQTTADNGDYVMADHMNSVQSSILAIENALGTNPQGSSISVSKRFANIEKIQALMVPRITTYKGDPLLINGAADVELAARYFSYFNYVILSDIDPDSATMMNVEDVIEKTKTCGQTMFYAIIDAGVSTSNLTVEAISVIMDKWKSAGASGIYFDNFGYDMGVTRVRQNSLLNSAHNRGFNVIVYANNIEDIFSLTNTNNANPDFIESIISSNDAVFVKEFAIGSSGYKTLATIQSIEPLLAYRKTIGTKIFATASIDSADAITAQKQYYYAQALALLYSLDAFHAIKSTQGTGVVYRYNTLPLIGKYYDINPIVTENLNVLSRLLEIGSISVDIGAHTYKYDKIKVPLQFIDLDADDTIIPFSRIGSITDLTLGGNLNVNGTITIGENLTDGTYSVNVANMSAAYSHITSNGSSHSFINQDVKTTAQPTFAGITNTGRIEIKTSGGLNANSAPRAISWYDPTYYTWADYMAPGVETAGYNGSARTTLGSVTSWARVSNIESIAGYGWIWESGVNDTTVPTAKMALASDTGNLYLTGDLSIGNANTTTDKILTITSKANAGIKIIADTDNVGETHNPYVSFSQDAAAVQAIIGLVGGVNIDPVGSTYTGILDNALMLGSLYSFGALQLGTNSNARLTILPDGKVGIGTNGPTEALHVSGNTKIDGSAIFTKYSIAYNSTENSLDFIYTP